MGSYDTTIGTLLVGILFNTFLYGLVTYQFAAYHRTKFNDRPTIKYMVCFLFIVDTFHSISAIYVAWYYTVTNCDNPAALTRDVWPYILTPIINGLAALVTQLYLGFRIWRFAKSRVLYGVVIMLAIPAFVLAVICSIETWIIDVMSELPRITPLVIAWLTMQVIADVFITVTLIIVFSRSRTGFQRTDTILNRLIRGAIQTGLFAVIFSIGDLISFIVIPNTNIYGMFAIPMGRIYTNTLLDTLLTRESLKTRMSGTDGASCPLTSHVVVTCPESLQSGPMDWDSPRATSTVQSGSFQLEVKKTIWETCDHPSDDAGPMIVPLAVVEV